MELPRSDRLASVEPLPEAMANLRRILPSAETHAAPEGSAIRPDFFFDQRVE